MSELLSLNEKIKSLVTLDIKEKGWRVENSTYIKINSDNSVNVGGSELLVFNDWKFIIGYLGCVYVDRGYEKSTFKKLFMLDNNLIMLDEVKLKNWSLNFNFLWSRYGYNTPNAKISLKINPNLFLEYELDSFQEVQIVWNFMNELDDNYQTYDNGELFLKYYKQKIELNETKILYENFKATSDREKDLNEKYKELLVKIENLLKDK
jgi:hypothetical protein